MLFLTIGLILLAAFKLWLVRGDRIVARPLPQDDLDYLKAASNWYWGAKKYGVLTFVRLPGYPLFVALSRVTRLPLRFTTELLQLAGAAAAALAFYFSGMRRWFCLVLYGALIFQPATFAQNCYASTDAFFTAITFFALAALVMQLATQRLVFAVLSGLAIGVLWNTREEAILMAGYVAGFFVILLWNCRDWRLVARHAAVTCAVIAVICIGCDTANYVRYGNFAKSDFASHDFQAAIKALLRIKPATETPRYVPVPAATRQLAYAASPALRELAPLLDGTAGRGWKELGAPVGIQDDYVFAYLLWGLRDIAAQAGKYESPQVTRAYYRQVADQINGAIARGELPHRFVFSTFTDPDLSQYVRYFPGSVLRICGTFAAAQPAIAPPWSATGGPPVSPRQADLFRRMTNETKVNCETPGRVTMAIREAIARSWGPGIACLTALAVVALAYLLIADRARFLRSTACAVLAVVMMIVAGRVVILGMISCSSWDADSPRYLLPVFGLYGCALAMIIHEAALAWRTRGARR